MIDVRDIHSFSDFQGNAKQYLQHIKQTHKPLILTVNGKAVFVVQDAEAYQKLLDRLDYAESVAAIRKGIEEFDRKEGRSAREALEELREKSDISR